MEIFGLDLMFYIWIFVTVIMFFIEAQTLNLVTVWFGLSALMSLIANIIGLSIIIQLLVFIVTAIILLLITRPLVKKAQRRTKIKTNSDALIGNIAKATTSFKAQDRGYVIINAMEWLAISYEDDIEIGDKVVVEKIDGAKLVVTKYKDKLN